MAFFDEETQPRTAEASHSFDIITAKQDKCYPGICLSAPNAVKLGDSILVVSEYARLQEPAPVAAAFLNSDGEPVGEPFAIEDPDGIGFRYQPYCYVDGEGDLYMACLQVPHNLSRSRIVIAALKPDGNQVKAEIEFRSPWFDGPHEGTPTQRGTVFEPAIYKADGKWFVLVARDGVRKGQYITQDLELYHVLTSDDWERVSKVDCWDGYRLGGAVILNDQPIDGQMIFICESVGAYDGLLVGSFPADGSGNISITRLHDPLLPDADQYYPHGMPGAIITQIDGNVLNIIGTAMDWSVGAARANACESRLFEASLLLHTDEGDSWVSVEDYHTQPACCEFGAPYFGWASDFVETKNGLLHIVTVPDADGSRSAKVIGHFVKQL